MDKILQGFATDAIGWQFMWGILAVGFFALALCVERYIYISVKSGKGRKKLLSDVATLVSAQRFADAAARAQGEKTPLGKALYSVLSSREKGEAAMTKSFDEVYLTEAPRISRYLSILLVMANMSTLIGLLGTIFGLIYSFDAVANLPAAQRPAALADGIAAAMGTTFLGLVVAIPMMAFHGFLQLSADRIVEEMEEKTLKVINVLA
jgi:biopolymer transport protein ExbB